MDWSELAYNVRSTPKVEDYLMLFLSPAIISATIDSYKIVEIDRVSNFAGRMGREVRETWKVTKGGDEFTVIISRYHTNVARTPMYSTGDTVSISNAPHGKVIRVTLSEVKG
jgi:hypothetical protein